MITKRVGHVIRLQVGLTVLAALVAAGMAQDAMHAGLSALLGGAIVVMGALVYIGVAFARKRAAAPGVLVRRHFRAEALKMIVTAFLFVAVMLFFKSVSAGALLGGFAAAQSAYWLGLLSK